MGTYESLPNSETGMCNREEKAGPGPMGGSLTTLTLTPSTVPMVA